MAAVLRLRGAREASLFSVLPGEAIGFYGGTLRGTIVPGDDAFVLIRGWLAAARADELFETIRRTTVWRQERREMYDRVVDVPREQAWVGEGCERELWPNLAAVRAEAEALARVRFAFVLFNRYRDGNDSVAWHSDRRAPGAGEHAVVASLMLGATRAFDVRAKAARARVFSVDLDHGDLVLMTPAAQERFEHRVPKIRRVAGERINLTFRRNTRGAAPIEQEFERPSPIE